MTKRVSNEKLQILKDTTLSMVRNRGNILNQKKEGFTPLGLWRENKF
jgi:hypothetical protein